MAVLKSSAGLGRWLLFACSLAVLTAFGCSSPATQTATAGADSHGDSGSDTSVLFDTAGSDLGGDAQQQPDTTIETSQTDAADASDSDASEADSADSSDVASPDVVANCPGGPGCPCSSNSECDLLVCLDTPNGKICAQNCATSCPKDFVCTQFSGGGGDSTNLCAPQFGWRCEPCTASSQCTAPGQNAAACVVYGTQGAFCGSICSQDSECGPGFTCQTATSVEGTTSKQCVVIDNKNALPMCPCSKRAVSLGLSTICSNNPAPGIACSGTRVCKVEGMGGLADCDAPAPATETCNGQDDDCNGQTDEIGCDDGNPCTADACDSSKKACTHNPAIGLVCDDGNPCTLGDVCKLGACEAGVSVCECGADADCGKLEDGNLCNGTLYCDLTAVPYKCKQKVGSTVTCDPSADTVCSKAACDPATGACAAKPVANATACDDGNACSLGDACMGGKCAAGTNICECMVTSDCASKEDVDQCNGTLVCDTSAAPYKCKLDPATVVTCDTSSDSACIKTTCAPLTGKCAPSPVTGVVCDDGNPCTAGDVCKAGGCAGGSNICGCQQDADCASNEDGDLCNGTLFCAKGAVPYSCQVKAATIVVCDASGDTTCAKSACEKATGKCAAKPVTDGVACSDGSACTGPDQCSGGSCAGVAISCDDKNPCTDDACDPTSGCKHGNNSAACSDANACTLVDVCAGGSCVAGSPPSCSDGLKNGSETDKDCGGTGTCGLAACPACGAGGSCGGAGDCVSKVCSGGTCTPATCQDSVQNGDETDIDCGGPSCMACPTVLLVATGGATVAGELGKAGTWKLQTFATPSVDAPSIVVGTTYGMAALRYTKNGDLQDNQVQALKWTYQGWGAPSVLGSDVTTQGRPALALVGSTVLLMYHGNDFKYYSSLFTGSWSPVAWVGNPQAYGPMVPAAATLGSSALMVYIDGSNGNHLSGKVFLGSWGGLLDGGAGPDFSVAPAAIGTGSGSALAVYTKAGGSAAFETFGSGSWSGASDVPQVWTKFPVGMARDLSGLVWVAFHGTDDKLYITSYSSSKGWATPAQVAAAGSIASSPAVAYGLSGQVELVWVDGTGIVWHATQAGTGWSLPKQVATGAKHVALARVQ